VNYVEEGTLIGWRADGAEPLHESGPRVLGVAYANASAHDRHEQVSFIVVPQYGATIVITKNVDMEQIGVQGIHQDGCDAGGCNQCLSSFVHQHFVGEID